MASVSRPLFNLPLFLTPAFAEARPILRTLATKQFSSTAYCAKDPLRKKDANKKRGVSALRSTGTRKKLLVDRFPLPQPVSDVSAKRAEIPMREDHGLYQFFTAERELLLPPSEEDSYGRAWTKKELSRKSFDDLWKLHWTCIKEANRVSTREMEIARLRAGYGATEAAGRLETVRRTINNIRAVLARRYDDYTNSERLLNTQNIRDIFPDAEASLHLFEPVSAHADIKEYKTFEVESLDGASKPGVHQEKQATA